LGREPQWLDAGNSPGAGGVVNNVFALKQFKLVLGVPGVWGASRHYGLVLGTHHCQVGWFCKKKERSRPGTIFLQDQKKNILVAWTTLLL
jgi:hypothetical protein